MARDRSGRKQDRSGRKQDRSGCLRIRLKYKDARNPFKRRQRTWKQPSAPAKHNGASRSDAAQFGGEVGQLAPLLVMRAPDDQIGQLADGQKMFASVAKKKERQEQGAAPIPGTAPVPEARRTCRSAQGCGKVFCLSCYPW